MNNYRIHKVSKSRDYKLINGRFEIIRGTYEDCKKEYLKQLKQDAENTNT